MKKGRYTWPKISAKEENADTNDEVGKSEEARRMKSKEIENITKTEENENRYGRKSMQL